jgi:hypothetical protein
MRTEKERVANTAFRRAINQTQSMLRKGHLYWRNGALTISGGGIRPQKTNPNKCPNPNVGNAGRIRKTHRLFTEGAAISAEFPELTTFIKKAIRDRLQDWPWDFAHRGAWDRCNQPNAPSYRTYGATGIKCQITARQLLVLFVRDKAYLMDRPSVDRIDTYGNYTMANCRWLELSENLSRPKRKNVR